MFCVLFLQSLLQMRSLPCWPHREISSSPDNVVVFKVGGHEVVERDLSLRLRSSSYQVQKLLNFNLVLSWEYIRAYRATGKLKDTHTHT